MNPAALATMQIGGARENVDRRQRKKGFARKNLTAGLRSESLRSSELRCVTAAYLRAGNRLEAHAITQQSVQ